MTATLVKTHRICIPQADRVQRGNKEFQVVHVKCEQIERYMGACLSQLRQVRMAVTREIADIMHPPDEPGHWVRH